ncbi:ANKRD40 [Branchiostoma lanceolatum]|uniref:ANKRD40 protein n=2 Tax=Branchiostoma lanceolatum TaxID=7740 RepID=A0A8K0AG51_BRALA|nr:ANKRD40 [Branchiostoma lanceolatum]
MLGEGMDPGKEKEERLREAACVGDEDTLCSLLSSGVGVNSQNPVNGWSPLHWAVKRGHKNIVSRLLTAGADPALQTSQGQVPAQLTDSVDIRSLLGASPDESPPKTEPLPITPNYMANPPFPYGKQEQGPLSAVNGSAAGDRTAMTQPFSHVSGRKQYTPPVDQELVLKVRVANPMQMENDFIEIEMDRSKLTFRDLLAACCRELQVQPEKVQKIRKLPNTMLRKDKDVTRLHDFQEIELVLKTTNKPVNPQYVISPSTDGPASFVY